MTEHNGNNNSRGQGNGGNGGGTPPVDGEIARLIQEWKLATAEEVEAARTAAAASGETMGGVLVANGVITPSQLARIKKQIEEARHGQQLPGYQILAKLGAGAMATVFKARQISLDRPVAIKVLPRLLSENQDYVERFYKEGKAAAKLNHPNIVQAIDVGEAGGYHYFVMEYVEGHTLWDELQGGKRFTEKKAVEIVLQVARALHHAHSQGFIHRDIKPKNIMITPAGAVKLADMGLARAVADVEAAQAEAGKAFGTPYYISPEQIRGELDIDFRADIYSLGATLYHLLTGQLPFDGPTPAAVMHKHLKEPLVPPDHVNTALSTGIGEVVEVMMAKDRNRRYASTADLLVDLEAIAGGRPPLQARKQIDAGMLKGLADGQQIVEEPLDDARELGGGGGFMVVVIVLAAALALSIIINIVQAVHASH
ncbi:MAG: protein kinase [Planctomycetota bacterium]|nr:protein kinase [Planctomycetota bacterium]